MSVRGETTAPPSVRRAGMEDVPALAALFDAYRIFYGQPGNMEAAAEFLSQRLTRAESVVLVAPGPDENLLGFVQLYPSFSSTRMARTFVLNDLFVAPAGRRSGVARALLVAAERFAREQGVTLLSLSTARDNLAAQSLYRTHGWKEDETFLHFNRQLDS